MQIQLFFAGRMSDNDYPQSLQMNSGTTVSDALEQLKSEWKQDNWLPDHALLSVDGKHMGTIGQYDDCSLKDGSEIAVIMPVAGGMDP